MHFTGKERDAESGLDNFVARYYGSSLGRFMTPDLDNVLDDPPAPLPYGDRHDPQTLNLYSYVRNNPLNRIDSNGHKMTCTTDADGNIHCIVTPDPQPPDYIVFGTLLNLLFVQPVEALYRSVNPPNCPRCLSIDWGLCPLLGSNAVSVAFNAPCGLATLSLIFTIRPLSGLRDL
jgi:RHS repeat-associated protein